MKDWQDLGRELRRYTNVDTFPVAISFLNSRIEIPERTRTPVKDLKVRMAPCQLQAIARKYGWSIAMTRDDMGCAIAAHTYGWELANQEGVVQFLTRMNYAVDRTAALHIHKNLRTLAPGQYQAVIYAPLERVKVRPDVVLVYLNPAQLMRCLHGSTYHTGQPVNCSFSGRAASCTEGVLGAFIDQLPKVVVPGNGDRVWATVQDYEVAYAVPASHLKDLVEGLCKTQEAGIRYPISSYLRYQPEVGLSLPLSDIFSDQGGSR
jgi:uncharacterized protein (DUF169 family)